MQSQSAATHLQAVLDDYDQLRVPGSVFTLLSEHRLLRICSWVCGISI